jgi:hypothetical protein
MDAAAEAGTARLVVNDGPFRECEEWLQIEIDQTATIRSWTSAKIRKIEKAARKKTAQG